MTAMGNTAIGHENIRDTLQAEAVQTLLEHHRLVVNWGTGVGKSRVAVNAVEQLYARGCRRFLLLIAERTHRDNWRREFIDCKGPVLGDLLFGLIIVECYASLKKYPGTAWDCIIADEAHHLRGENRTELISQLRSDYFLALTATLSERSDGDALMKALTDTYGHFKSTTFGLQDAIDNGVLGEPVIYVHVLPLRDGEQDQELTLTWGFPKARRKIRCGYEHAEYYRTHKERLPNAELTVVCSPYQGYKLLTDAIAEAKAEYMAAWHDLQDGNIFDKAKSMKEVERLKNAWMLLGSRRKSFLGQCKTKFARWLLRQIGDKKYICFCADVKQGELLGGDRIVNSKRRDNDAVIRDFNEGRSSSLFAVGMIQEGTNLTGIEEGVILQLGGKERPWVQKFGRAMRSKNPVQHIVVFNHTHDIDYYRTAVENIDPKYIKIRRYDENYV